MDCRICQKETSEIIDLGAQPIANTLLISNLDPEHFYPLKFYWCASCQFGQVNNLPPEMIFGDDYPYYSSINTSYVKQCAEWAHKFLSDNKIHSILEIGCNDGYMLQNFKHLNHMGFEPSHGPASIAKEKGLTVVEDYFTGTDHNYCDLIIANNVLAHTPFLHETIDSIYKSLSVSGSCVVEFPTVDNLINNCYYDTIYHEHFSYFSLYSIAKLFSMHDLKLTSYDMIKSHGGSIRAYFKKHGACEYNHEINKKIDFFGKMALRSKINELQRILNIKSNGRSMALFGAAAKGNTFLNYLGIKNDIFDFCVDETPAKQGKFLPGTRIPIVGMEYLKEAKPHVLFILPWNFKDEIMAKTSFIKEWRGEFIWKV